MLVICALLLLPTMMFARWVNKCPACEADMAIRLYGQGFLPGALLVMVIELVLMVGFVMICFQDQIDVLLAKSKAGGDIFDGQGMTKNFGFFVFLLLMSFVVASLTEESMKYYVLNKVERQRPELVDVKAYLVYAVAPALGFSTIENLGYVANQPGFLNQLFLAIMRLLLATPVHCLTGYYMGIGVVRRKVMGERLPWHRIMGPAIIFHGVYDWGLFLLSTYGVTVDWNVDVMTMVFAVGVLLVFALFVRRARLRLNAALNLRERLEEASQAHPSAPPSAPGDVVVHVPSSLATGPDGVLR